MKPISNMKIKPDNYVKNYALIKKRTIKVIELCMLLSMSLYILKLETFNQAYVNRSVDMNKQLNKGGFQLINYP